MDFYFQNEILIRGFVCVILVVYAKKKKTLNILNTKQTSTIRHSKILFETTRDARYASIKHKDQRHFAI